MILRKLKEFFKEKKETKQFGIIHVNGIKVYYEMHGEGEPLLLIGGLGFASWMWFRQLPSFSKKFRVIVFDSRGVGRTEKPDEEYSIGMMADDAAQLLNSLNIKSANVLGVSMGGFIAQELALRYPDFVRDLVLVCTSSGFKNETFSNFGMWRDVMDSWGFDSKSYEAGNIQSPPLYINLSEEEIMRKGISETCALQNLILNKNEIDNILKKQLEFPQPSYAWKRQFQAGADFDAKDRISNIRKRTLVVAGSDDTVVPPFQSRELSEKIQNSRYIELKNTGHLLFIEEADRFNKIIIDFLEERSEVKPDSNK